jgi:hypothetical protein
LVPEPPEEAARDGLSSNSEGRLSRPSARSDGLDNVDGGPDGCVYTQMGGIEQVRVRGLLEGRRGTAYVAGVPGPDIGENLFWVGAFPPPLQF